MTKFSAPQQNQLAQIGAFLRDNREKQEKSLEDIAIRTYIRPQLLNGIETGDPDLLPEPIFVQGFIRRYAEALGINGIELSRQFTVDSIPSTPRPARQPIPTDSATTRITRVNGHQSSQPAKNVSNVAAAPMFSAGNVSPSNTEPVTNDRVVKSLPDDWSAQPPEIKQDSSPQSSSPQIFTNQSYSSQPDVAALDKNAFTVSDGVGLDPVGLDPVGLETETANNAALGQVSEDTFAPSATQEVAIQASVTQETTLQETASPDSDLAQSSPASADQMPAEQPSMDDLFASKVAAFDQPDVGTVNPEVTAEPATPRTSSSRTSSLSGDAFDSNGEFRTDTLEPEALKVPALEDELPSAFTTQPETPVAPVEPAVTSRVSPVAQPVGASYSSNDSPNLKPFVIGGVIVAALTAGVALFAMVLGGQNTSPTIADTPDPVEQVDSAAAESEAFLDDPVGTTLSEPEAAAEPPVSTAPVYVEATATSEAWVSIIADGVPIFEGTLQPGDTEVWEAQENLSVYSGDAGALELAANGNESAVMGEAGQPTEKIFPE